MRHAFVVLTAGSVLLLAGAPRATAQSFGGGYSGAFGGGGFNSRLGSGFQAGPTTSYPALSPYLNLVRGNNTPAINYFLGTLPEFDRRNFQSNILGALPTIEAQLAQPVGPPPDLEAIPTLPQTGHLSAFQAYGTWFNMGGVQQRPYYPLNPTQTRTTAPR
jgi:hypothetical protein